MEKFINRIAARIVWIYLQLVGKTSKIVWKNRDLREKLEREHKNFIYALWHGRQFFFAWVYRNSGTTILVSQSRDGEYIARVIGLFGMGTVRGSSSRGGVRSLVQLKRNIESGLTVALTPDGPRGPQRTVAPGVLYLAQKTAKPILPITYSAKHRIIFPGWDDYWVPLPFNTIVIDYGKPVTLTKESSLSAKTGELASELNRVTAEADLESGGEGSVLESIFYFSYNLLLIFLLPVILLGLFFRSPRTFMRYFFEGLSMRLGGRFPIKTMEASLPRRGSVGIRDFSGLGKERPIWVHAASLGECRASAPLISALRKKYPRIPVIFSSPNFNGIAEAGRLRLSSEIFYSPLDIPFVLNRVFRNLNPRIVILMESEIWPNWIRASRRFGAKIGIVNARISQRSSERYKKFKLASRLLMRKLDFICARELADAERFVAIGARPEAVRVTGNLKYDFFPWEELGSPQNEGGMEGTGGQKIWTCGSIREGEENAVLDSYSQARKKIKDLKLILAPRHLENLAKVEGLLKSLKLEFSLRSEIIAQDWDVMLWDTYGDLYEAYRMAAVVFVGGSLVPKGGQNPIEPAHFSKPVLFGPHMENFAEPAKVLLDSGGAIRVDNSSHLAEELCNLFSDPEHLRKTGENAKGAVQRIFGQATRKNMEILDSYVRS